jgi:quercetin dioxygenase-like cupin family protein/DNA-binding Xre family transcriptional regulator
MNVGEIIHRLRKERKMTLLELSKLSGVALATLSRMENGKMTGTLDSHMSICRSLGVSLPDFYRDLEASMKTVDVQAAKSRTEVFIHDKKAASEMLAPNVLNKKMMPTMVRIQKGGVTHREETRPGIEKFAYVLEGRLEASIGDEKFSLGKGDTLYFDSSAPHYFKNTGAGDARMICVVTPPAL